MQDSCLGSGWENTTKDHSDRRGAKNEEIQGMWLLRETWLWGLWGWWRSCKCASNLRGEKHIAYRTNPYNITKFVILYTTFAFNLCEFNCTQLTNIHTNAHRQISGRKCELGEMHHLFPTVLDSYSALYVRALSDKYDCHAQRRNYFHTTQPFYTHLHYYFNPTWPGGPGK